MLTEKMIETAKELGGLIRETDEFKRLTLAQMANEMDFEMTKKMKEFTETRDKLVAAMSGGNSDSPEVQELDQKLSKLYSEIKENEKVKELESASQAFDSVMKMVNDVLQFEITGETPKSCGTGGCASCAGCN